MVKYTTIEMENMVRQLFDNGNRFLKKGKSDIKNYEKQIKEAKRKLAIINEAIIIIHENL